MKNRISQPTRNLWRVLLTAAATMIAAAPPAVGASIDPIMLYGERIEFDVLRNGKRVGEHVTTFTEDGDTLRIDHRFELDVSVFIFSYAYRYTASATWRNYTLEKLTALVDDDGETSDVRVIRYGDRMEINGPGGMIATDAPIFPTHHWNNGVLSQNRVLNTITGQVDEVTITAVAREFVETEVGAVEATRYVYSGDLVTEVWYDGQGRWVKMAFIGTDGSSIEYICRRCQDAPTIGEAPS